MEVIETLQELSSYVYIAFLAMLPIGELRASIPLGMQQFHMAWYQALAASLLGNMVPVPLLLWVLPKAAKVLMAVPNPLGRFLAWRAERMRITQGRLFQRYGALALMLFVAVPLPLTGAWTGCLAAWVFNIPLRKALPPIGLGVLLAGVAVTALVATGSKLAGFFL